MKIAVQGTFIDTESIYSIGEIYTDHYENEVYCFDIHHFGGENKLYSLHYSNILNLVVFHLFRLVLFHLVLVKIKMLIVNVMVKVFHLN